MELKTFFVQDSAGNVILGPTVTVYEAGTATLATGLKDKDGAALTNPFTGGVDGSVQFAAPNGAYDVEVSNGVLNKTTRQHFIDALPKAGGTLESVTLLRYTETVAAASSAIDRADGGIQTLTLSADTTLTWTLNDGESIKLYLTPAGFSVTSWGIDRWMTAEPTLATENVILVEKVGGVTYGWDSGSRT